MRECQFRFHSMCGGALSNIMITHSKNVDYEYTNTRSIQSILKWWRRYVGIRAAINCRRRVCAWSFHLLAERQLVNIADICIHVYIALSRALPFPEPALFPHSQVHLLKITQHTSLLRDTADMSDVGNSRNVCCDQNRQVCWVTHADTVGISAV